MKKQKKRKKHHVTLIEIMIVILLIGLIGGALAYNMKGSLNEGKKFKTNQCISKVEDILMLEYSSTSKTLDEIKGDWKAIVQKSPLVKGDNFIKDAWGRELVVDIDSNGDGFIVRSKSPGMQ